MRRRGSNSYIYTDSNYTRISGKQINNNNNNNIMAAIIGLVVV
jgi:hypothetical protein